MSVPQPSSRPSLPLPKQLSIGAPNLVVPLDCHAPRTLALCADLGRLSLATDLDPDRDRRIAKGEAVEEDAQAPVARVAASQRVLGPCNPHWFIDIFFPWGRQSKLAKMPVCLSLH